MNVLLCRHLEHNSLNVDKSEKCFGQILEANETNVVDPKLHTTFYVFELTKRS
jgi:hypothetical protein